MGFLHPTHRDGAAMNGAPDVSGARGLACEEAERAVGGFADADARGGEDCGGTEAVVDDLERGGGAGDVEGVGVDSGDVEGLAEAAGAGG